MSISSLRRLARPPEPSAPRPAGSGPGERAADQAAGPVIERCELCAEILDARHGHLVDVDTRALQCACRACYLLFTQEGAASGRRRAVPDRVRHDPASELTRAEWDELSIPVATAFFFHNSAMDRVVAFYPSPAGATESLLDLDAWRRLAESHPLLAAIEADVEAILATKTEQGREVFLVPIDVCYALVGELRRTWQGFDGGTEAHEALAAFLEALRERSYPFEAARR